MLSLPKRRDSTECSSLESLSLYLMPNQYQEQATQSAKLFPAKVDSICRIRVAPGADYSNNPAHTVTETK